MGFTMNGKRISQLGIRPERIRELVVQIEKQQKIKRNKNQGSVKRDFLSYHNRSREHEYEADSEGFKKFF